MRVLCEYTGAGPHFVRSGWANVFLALGHEFKFWDMSRTPAFDIFNDYNPDIFLGCTYSVNRAIIKCIKTRPNLKVGLFASAWGPYLKDIDLKKFPLVVVTEQEKHTIEQLRKETGAPSFVFIHAHDRWLEGTMSGWGELGIPYLGVLNAFDVYTYSGGRYRPELACDWAFVGSRWPYKAVNLDRYILPLCHPSTNLKGKIFGGAGWDVASQWLGTISDSDQKDLFNSAIVCPNVSEPHSTRENGHDCVERMFKVPGAGGMCVSDYVEEGRALFTEDELPMATSPADFVELIKHFVRHPSETKPYKRRAKAKVLANHTYNHRVATLLDGFGMKDEAKRAIDLLPTLPC